MNNYFNSYQGNDKFKVYKGNQDTTLNNVTQMQANESLLPNIYSNYTNVSQINEKDNIKNGLFSQIFGSIDDVAAKFGTGFVKGWEGILDYVANALTAISGDERFSDWAKQDIASALAEYTKTYQNYTPWGIVNNIANGNYGNSQYWEDMWKNTKDIVGSALFVKNSGVKTDYSQDKANYYQLDDQSFANNGVGNFVEGLAGSLGEMLPSIMISGGISSVASEATKAAELANEAGNAIKAAQLTAKAAKLAKTAKVVGYGTFGLAAAGNASEESLNKGISSEKALAYGTAKGAIEVASEIVVGEALNGISKVTGVDKALGKFGGNIGGWNIAKETAKATTGRQVAIQVGKTMFEEGAEEVFSDLIAPLAESIISENTPLEQYKESFSDPQYWKDMAKSFASGAVMGGITGGGQNVMDYYKNGKDVNVVLNQYSDLLDIQDEYNEAKVNNASQEVLNEIEERAGYKYKEIVEALEQIESSDDAKQRFIQALGGNYNMSYEDFNKYTQASVQDRFMQYLKVNNDKVVARTYVDSENNKLYVDDSVIQKLSKPQQQRVNEVLKVVNGIRQKFGIDYNVVFSNGLTNGRRRFNGLKFKNTIFLDVNSNKALHKTLMHELVHTLEGTKTYSKLAEFTKQWYNETKGTDAWENEFKEKKKEYAQVGQTSGSIIEQEMIADAVGDMFNTVEDARKLVQENRTLAQRIKNWIAEKINSNKGDKQISSSLKESYNALKEALAEKSENTVEELNTVLSYSAKDNQYTQKQYENYGWVRANDILSKEEYGLFNKALSDLKNGEYYNKNSLGEYMIPVGEKGILNKIVYAKGTYINPKITKVLEINLNDETILAFYREVIYESEQQNIRISEQNSSLLKEYVRDAFSYQSFINKSTKPDSSGIKNGTRSSGKAEGDRKENEIKYSISKQQNDLIAQSYEIQYSKTKDGDYNIYMADRYGNLIYTHPMITELSLKNRLGDDLSKFITSNATNEVQKLKRKDIEKYIQELDNSELHKKAQKYYKHTNNTRIAAYLDLDGFMYDLDQGDSDGYYRGTDHRDIQSVTEGLTGSEAMEEFMYQGNIRLKPESNGFELVKLPTDKQFIKLRYWIEQRNDDVIGIDLWKDINKSMNNSDNLTYVEYPAYTRSSRIINDIKRFYNEGIVPEITDVDKFRYSISEDSAGHRLTVEQDNYFKDSKVRDEDGNLLVVYHGTKSDFNIFDINKAGESNNIARIGFWFTTSAKGAKNFSNDAWWGNRDNAKALRGYLDIKNPKIFTFGSSLSFDGYDKLKAKRESLYQSMFELSTEKYGYRSGINHNQTFRTFVNQYERGKRINLSTAVTKYEDALTEEDIKQAKKDAIEYVNNKKQFEEIDEKINEEKFDDSYEKFRTDIYKSIGMTAQDANIGGIGMAFRDKATNELLNVDEVINNYRDSLIKQGYDGIIIKDTSYDEYSFGGTNTQYVIFNSNQFKKASNKTPTTSEDIRFSIQGENDGRKEEQRRNVNKNSNEEGTRAKIWSSNRLENVQRKWESLQSANISEEQSRKIIDKYLVSLNSDEFVELINSGIMPNTILEDYYYGAIFDEHKYTLLKDVVDFDVIDEDGKRYIINKDIYTDEMKYIEKENKDNFGINTHFWLTDGKTAGINIFSPDGKSFFAIEAFNDEHTNKHEKLHYFLHDLSDKQYKEVQTYFSNHFIRKGELRFDPYDGKTYFSGDFQKAYINFRYKGYKGFDTILEEMIAETYAGNDPFNDSVFVKDIQNYIDDIIGKKYNVDMSKIRYSIQDNELKPQIDIIKYDDSVNVSKVSKTPKSAIDSTKPVDSAYVKGKANYDNDVVIDKKVAKKLLDDALKDVYGVRKKNKTIPLTGGKDQAVDYIFQEMNKTKLEDILNGSANESMAQELATNIVSRVFDKNEIGIIKSNYNDLVNELTETIQRSYLQDGKVGGYKAFREKVSAKISSMRDRIRWLKRLVVETRKVSRALKSLNKLETRTYNSAPLDALYKRGLDALKKITMNNFFNAAKMKEVLSEYKEAFYNEKNELISDGYSSQVVDLIDFVLNSKGSTLDIYEMNAVVNILTSFNHLVKTQDQIIFESHKAKASEVATNLKKDIGSSGKLNKNTFNNVVNSLEKPKLVLRKLDGSTGEKNNSLTELVYDNLKSAEDVYIKNHTDFELELIDFGKTHKRFYKKLFKHKIKVKGYDISLGEAITLYQWSRRQQARGHFIVDDNANAQGVNLYSQKNGNYIGTFKMTQEDIDALEQEIKTIDGVNDYISLIDSLMEKARALKEETDFKALGFTNTVDDYYFPITTDKSYNSYKNYGDVRNTKAIDSVLGLSMNQNVITNASNKLRLENVYDILNRHLNQVSKYNAYYITIKAIQKGLNYKVDNVSASQSLSQISPDANTYIDNLIVDVADVQVKEQNMFTQVSSFLRGNLATSNLGLNAKVVVNQLSSIPTALSKLSAKSVAKSYAMPIGAKTSAEMDNYSNYAKYRHLRNVRIMPEIYRSDSNTIATDGFNTIKEGYRKAQRLVMRPISWMDRRAMVRLWNACQVEVESKYGLKIGTEENKVKAGELLEEVIRETQPDYSPLETPSLKKSKSEIMRWMTMFTTQPLQNLNQIMDAAVDIRNIKAQIKINGKTNELTSALKQVYTKLARNVASVTAANLMYTLIALGFKHWLDKDDDEKGLLSEFITDFIGTNVGMIPVVREFYNKFANNYDISADPLGAVNDFIDASKSIYTSVNSGNYKGLWYKFSKALSTLTGLPFKNVNEYVMGIIGTFDPDVAYKYRSIWYNKTVSEFTNDLEKAYSKGNTNRASGIIQAIYNSKGIKINDSLANTLASIGEKDTESIISLRNSTNKNVTVNDESITLNGTQVTNVTKAYNKAVNTNLTYLTRNSYFANLTKEEKAYAIKLMNKSSYYEALSKTLNTNIKEDKINLLKKAFSGNTYYTFVSAYAKCKTTYKGNKEQIQKYINSLRLSKEQKYILYGLLGYKPLNDNAYTLVSNYLSTKSYSSEFREYILKSCKLVE